VYIGLVLSENNEVREMGKTDKKISYKTMMKNQKLDDFKPKRRKENVKRKIRGR